jgi:hypothetical protein
LGIAHTQLHRIPVGKLLQTDHLRKALPVDILHGVVVDAALATDEIDVNNVGVVQVGGGLHLPFEPLELLGIKHPGKGQHLESHAPTE